jgi:hypothetical protein
VDTAVTSGNDFDLQGVSASEGGVLADGPYAGRTWRRLPIVDGATPGSSIFLRWHETVAPGGFAATSASALEDSLRDGGNYGAGFEEAAWPTGFGTAPVSYPLNPGSLDADDWVWGTPDWKTSASLSSILDAQIVVGRPMVLPIYSIMIGSGSNVQVRATRLGQFVLIGQGSDASLGRYLDLVFLGAPDSSNRCASSTPLASEGGNHTASRA